MLPAAVFVMLTLLEMRRPLLATSWDKTDWLLNGSGLVAQGLVIPWLSLGIGGLLAAWLPSLDGLLPGAAAAFLLSFAGLDLLYYWQHRWFHGPGWPLHRPHHGAKRLGAWVSSRNTLAAHPLFVYLLPSAVLALLCEHKLAYFAGVMLTASLDLWRHCAIRWPDALAPAGRLVALVLITPMAHHWHHRDDAPRCNFGANLSLWDRLFGTYLEPPGYPVRYGVPTSQPAWLQLIAPWRENRSR